MGLRNATEAGKILIWINTLGGIYGPAVWAVEEISGMAVGTRWRGCCAANARDQTRLVGSFSQIEWNATALCPPFPNSDQA
jgi:hypothetical protein